MNEHWNTRFLRLAHEVASWSKDQSTRVGAVVVRDDNKTPVTFAYNGFPRGIDDSIEDRHARPLKYSWTSHAEENAICNAARLGASTEGATLYVTHFPCTGCARKLIQAGFSKVVVDGRTMDGEFLERWAEEIAISKVMFAEVQIELVLWDPDKQA